MSVRVLFNGAVLVKPTGATRVDTSRFVAAALAGLGIVALIGEADAGEPNSINMFSNGKLAANYFRSGPLADAAQLAFAPGNDPRIPGGASSVVCIKTNQSTQSQLTLKGSGTGSAAVQAANASPYNLEPGQTVVVSVDGGGDQTATFTATAATKAGGGAVSTTGVGNIVLTVNGGEVQTLPIGAGLTTAAQVAQAINDNLRDATAVVNGTAVDIRSDRRGSSAVINITSVTATNTSISTGSASGTGNVASIDAVTAVEAATIIDAAVTGITAGGDPLLLTNDTVGSGTLQVKNTSTAVGFGFPNTVASAVAPVDVLTLTSKDYGIHTKKIGTRVSDSGGGKIIEFTFDDLNKRLTETSPVLGAVAELSLQYTGNGGTATLSITDTQILVTLGGAASTDGSVSLSVPFASYPKIIDVVNFINSQVGYTASVITPTPYSFDSSNLDYVSGIDAKTSPYSAFAKNMRIAEWVNENSSLVTATRASPGSVAPLATTGVVYLAGGARGVSANSNWQAAFDELLSTRVNTVVPLISRDLSNLNQGSTATFSSVAAMLDAHVAFRSSTKGKSEAQGHIGMKGTKTQVLAQSTILNSPHTCLSAQKLTSDLIGRELEEWSFAVIAAAMRAGAELGEPLTWKYMRASNITQDPSWNPTNNGEEMILGGIMFAEFIPTKGIRICKGITTYTRDDNDAYREESVVMGWKNVSYELRTHLEDLFVGRRLNIDNVDGVKSEAEGKLSNLKTSGQIVDSVEADGTRLNAFRNLEVRGSRGTVELSVECSPVEGINFVLNNIYVVPAVINA